MKILNTDDESVKIVSSSDMFYDDCPVCRALKNAEAKDENVSAEEIEDLFNANRNKQ